MDGDYKEDKAVVKIFYFTNRGTMGNVVGHSLEDAINKYYEKRSTGAGWGHYFKDEKRYWV